MTRIDRRTVPNMLDNAIFRTWNTNEALVPQEVITSIQDDTRNFQQVARAEIAHDHEQYIAAPH